MFKIGTVTNYLEKTGVCIVELIQDIYKDYNIKVMHELKDTYQVKIEFIQIGSKKVDMANKGQTVVIKFDEKIKKGSEIYKC